MRRKIIKIFTVLILCFWVSTSFGSQSVDVESLRISHLTTVVTITTTATPLPTTALAGRKVILVQNISTSKVYLGNSAITADEESTGGYQLPNQYDSWRGDFTEEIVVYGRVASGSAKVVVWEAR